MYIKCDKLQNLTPCQFYESRELYLEGATKILSLCAEARTVESDVTASEIRVKYLLTIRAIYQGEDGLIDVKEDSVELSNAIRGVTGGQTSALIDTEVIGIEHHGISKVKVRVMLEQKGVVAVGDGFTALDDEGLVLKNDCVKSCSIKELRGVESLITTVASVKSKLGRILTSYANITVKNVSQATDLYEINGEASVYVTHLFEGGICGEIISFPFSLEIAQEGVLDTSDIDVLLKPISLSLVATETDVGTDVEIELLVSVGGYYADCEEVDYPVDAYSKTKELSLKKADVVISEEACNVRTEERFSEVVPFENITNAEEILCIGAPWVGASNFALTPNAVVQGIVCSEVVLKLGDGSIDRVVAEVPFSIAIRDKVECSGNIALDVKVVSISARLRYGSAIEVSGVLQISLRGKSDKLVSYLEGVEELGERLKNDSVISVYLVGEGECLFDCAKALRSDEEELLALNPDLTLPLKAGDKVLLYHPL